MKRNRKDAMNKFASIMRKEIHHKNTGDNDVVEHSEITAAEQQQQNKDVPSEEYLEKDIASYQNDNQDETNPIINLPIKKEFTMTHQTQTQRPAVENIAEFKEYVKGLASAFAPYDEKVQSAVRYTDYQFKELIKDYNIPQSILEVVEVYYNNIEWLYEQFSGNVPMIAQAIIKVGKANHYVNPENGLPRNDLHIAKDEFIIEKDIYLIAMVISDMLNLQNQFGSVLKTKEVIDNIPNSVQTIKNIVETPVVQQIITNISQIKKDYEKNHNADLNKVAQEKVTGALQWVATFLGDKNQENVSKF